MFVVPRHVQSLSEPFIGFWLRFLSYRLNYDQSFSDHSAEIRMRIKDSTKIHEDNIVRLSKLFPNMSTEVIKEKYNSVRKQMEVGIKIHHFIPILAYRQTLVLLVKK